MGGGSFPHPPPIAAHSKMGGILSLRFGRGISEETAHDGGDGGFHAQDSRSETYRCESDFSKRFNLAIDEAAFRPDGKDNRLRNMTRGLRFNAWMGQQREMPIQRLWEFRFHECRE